MEALRYDEGKHQYFRGETPLVSVTQVIHSVWPRTDGAPVDAIERARLRGTWVDEKFMEYLTTDDGLVIPAGTPQEYADCLGQAVNWWEAERAGSSVECQVRLFGEREAGTADLIVNSREIIELKSTWEISKTVPAQLGGYGDLFDEQQTGGSEHGMKCGVLHVHRRFKKAQFKAVDYPLALGQWRIVRDFYRLINGVI